MKFDYIQDGTGFGTSISCENTEKSSDDAAVDSLLNAWRVRFAGALGANAGPCAPLRGVRRDEEPGNEELHSDTAKSLGGPRVRATSSARGFQALGPSPEGSSVSGGVIVNPPVQNVNPRLSSGQTVCSRVAKMPVPGQFDNLAGLVDPYAFGGFDGGARWSLFGSWDWGQWCRLAESLKTWSEEHEQRRVPLVVRVPGLDRVDWTYRGAGRSERRAFGDNNVGLVHCLERGGIRLYINSAVDCRTITRENGQVGQIGQLDRYCVAIGVIFDERSFRGGVSLFALADVVRETVAALGLTIEDDIISRVDYQVTTDLVSVDDFRTFAATGLVCSRARLHSDFKGKRIGEHGSLYWGGRGAKLRLRVYDKMAELLETMHENEGEKIRYYFDALGDEWVAGYFSGDRKLTRVEFELHRGLLADFRVRRMDDLKTNWVGIVRYFSCEWFRILSAVVDTSNKIRTRLGEFWSRIADCFQKLAAYHVSYENTGLRVTRRKRERGADHLPHRKTSREFLRRALSVYLRSLGVGTNVTSLSDLEILHAVGVVIREDRAKLDYLIESREAGQPRFRSFVDLCY